MVLFSSTVSYYLKSDKIWILFLNLVGNSVDTVSGSRGGARGARGSPLFLDLTEARRAEKKLFYDRPPYLTVWMTALPVSEGL